MNSAWDMTWGRGVILIAGVAAFAAVFSKIDPNDVEFWRVALCTGIAFVAITLWNYEAVRNEPIRALMYLMFTVGFAFLTWLHSALGVPSLWRLGGR